MFGLFTRIKNAALRNTQRRVLMAEQDAQIANGFGALRTAVDLVSQAASGRGPRCEVVQIGDGFYVEQHADGSRRTVVLDKSKVPTARVEKYVAHVDITGTELRAP